MAKIGVSPTRSERLGLLAARLVLTAVFATAAIPKILNPTDFAVVILNYQVCGTYTSVWIALFLPWLALVCAIGLFAPALRRASGLVLAGLLIVFILLHGQAWARGLEIACGCFGDFTTLDRPKTNYAWLLLRNALLLATCWLVIMKDLRSQQQVRVA